MEKNPNRTGRNAETTGNLGRREFFFVAHPADPPLPFRKLFPAGSQSSGQPLAGGSKINDGLLQPIDHLRIKDQPGPLRMPTMSEDHVSRDSQRIGKKGARFIEPFGVRENPGSGLLHQLFGLGQVMNE